MIPTDTQASARLKQDQKDTMLTSEERHPFRPGIAKEWEAEHIYNLTHQERSITIAKRYLIRYIIRRSCCKDETVEHGVDDITNGSGCNQSYQDDIQLPMLSRLDNVAQIPQQNTDGGEAQQTKPELADKRHSPSHSIVLNELNKNQSVTRTDSPRQNGS